MFIITMLLYVIAMCLYVPIYHLKLCPRSLDLKCPGMNMFVSITRGIHVGIQVGVTKGTLTFPPVITGLCIVIEVFKCDCFFMKMTR